MVQRIQLQTPEGMREFPYLPTAAALIAAADAGDIVVGQEVIYREYRVLVLEDFELLILDRVGGMVPPEFVPPFGGVGGADWKVTVNGVPVDPAQFMNGGPVNV